MRTVCFYALAEYRASELLSESGDPHLVTLSSLIGAYLLSSLSLTSAVVEFVRSESGWTLDGGLPGLVDGGLLVATVTGNHGEGDEVWRRGSGGGGGLLLSITDDDLSVLRQTEVSAVVVDAAHPPFTGTWQRLTLVDVCEM